MRIKVIDFLYCNHLFEALDSILYIIVYPDYALRSISIFKLHIYSNLIFRFYMPIIDDSFFQEP